MVKETEELNNNWLGYTTNMPQAGGTRNRPNRSVAPTPAPAPQQPPSQATQAVNPARSTGSNTSALVRVPMVPAKKVSGSKSGPSAGVSPAQRKKVLPKSRRLAPVPKASREMKKVQGAPKPAKASSASKAAGEEVQTGDEDEEEEYEDASGTDESDEEDVGDDDDDFDEEVAHSGDEEDEGLLPAFYELSDGVGALLNRPMHIPVKPQPTMRRRQKRETQRAAEEKARAADE